MKRNIKRLFGFIGIIFIVAMTIFAACLPSPLANATQSVTDTIQVRVVGDTPDVRFNNIINRSVTVLPEKNFTIDYEKISSYVLTIYYTDKNDAVTSNDIDTITADDESAGSKNYLIKFDSSTMTLDSNIIHANRYGYGEYQLSVLGSGHGTTDSDDVVFYYIPVTGELTHDTETDKYYLNLDYTPESDNGGVTKVIARIYNSRDELIDIIIVDDPTKIAELPSDGIEYESGEIYAKLEAYNAMDEEMLYKPYTTNTLDYTKKKEDKKEDEEPDIDVPDTGKFLGKLDISQEDFLLTGLIIFCTVVIACIVFLNKSGKNKRAHLKVKRRRK